MPTISLNWSGVVAPIIVFVAGQLVAVVIWGVSLNESVSYLSELVAKHEKLVPDLYRTSNDVQRALTEIGELQMRIDDLEEAVARHGFQNIIEPIRPP